MSDAVLEARVSAIRRFNRLFTRRIGVLREGLLHSPYSLTEARIIFELAHQADLTASDIGEALGLDAGYLSRILGKLEEQELLEKTRSTTDGRQRLLNLTAMGKEAFALLDNRSREEVSELLNELSEGEQQRLLDAMQAIEGILGHGFKYAEPFFLRQHEPGDMGWVIEQHGTLYTQEYGWNADFEALVAQICAGFLKSYVPERERCWIAEMQGERVGSVFCVREDDRVAKLRLLLVHPKARSLGLGSKLVEACTRFARRAGYQTLTLWTNDVLVEARHIYEKKGFKLVEEEKHHSFGHDLTGQNWKLAL